MDRRGAPPRGLPMKRNVLWRSTLTTALALGSVAFVSGCDVDAYCFVNCADDGTTSAGGSGGQGEGGQTTGFTTLSGGGGGSVDCGDTQSSLENCGACGNACELAGAIPVCVQGECVIQACLDGQYDIDLGPANGCEYACPVPSPDIELCDGIDNDCDSLVDADDPDLTAPTTLCNQTVGTPCEMTQVLCDGENGWYCSYPVDVETEQGFIRITETLCDGLDGNCDGSLDEWFVQLGDVCSDTALGLCKDFGLVVCDAMNANQTACDLSAAPAPGVAQPEACDGIDNDCNGLIDDALPDAAFDMVPVVGVPGVLVDRYEASRPDATSSMPGIMEQVACATPMVLPWTGGGYAEATTGCTARGVGYRLCTLAELESACRGSLDTTYPYGDAYAPMTCNGVDRGSAAALATGSLAGCVSSPDPIYDMSGNVAEWTSTQTNAAPAPNRIFALSGGSYESPKLGLACTIGLQPRALEGTLLPNIGFRCCKGP